MDAQVISRAIASRAAATQPGRAAQAVVPESGGYLSVHGVRKEYRGSGGQPTPVLSSIDFEVQAGEFVAFVGASGAGKTTLLKIIAGLLEPTAGRVQLQGRTITCPPREMVYLSQQYSKSLLPWRTVIKNVEFPLEHRAGISRAERRERAQEALRGVGLAEAANRYPWQLSGGMQQRVTIARALAARPSVLLLDEAFSSVDALTRMELQDLVLDTWQRHALTILLVTHDIDEAIYLSDRVAVLSRCSPSRIVETLATRLSRPRAQIATRADPRFLELRNHLYELVCRPGEAL
jgi:NitT/TauT family transport system ATP-binding protein